MMNKKLLTLLCAPAIIAPTLPNLPVYSDIIRPLASGITLLERIKQEEISSKAEGRQSHAAHLRALQEAQLQINQEYAQALSAVINAESLNNWVQRTTVMYPASFGGDQTTVRYSRPWGQQTTGVMHAPGFGVQQLQPWWQQTTDVMHMQSLHANRQKAIQAQYASTMQHANPRERESVKQIEQAQAESVKQAVTHILRVKTITKDSELAPLTAKAATRVSNTIDEAVAQARTEEREASTIAIAEAVAQARTEEQAARTQAIAEAVAQARTEEQAASARAIAEAVAQARTEEQAARTQAIAEAVAQTRTEERAIMQAEHARAIAEAVAQARIEEQAPNNLQNDLGDM